MGTGKRSSYEFNEEEDAHEEIDKAGKALLSPPKGKDALLRLLKGAGDSLAEAAQSSESAKLAAHNLAKGLGRPEFLRHKDKEVRLYTALCLCHILRLNAPDTPYTDDQLQGIFELLTRTYGELEDPASPHFQLCLSILETVSQVKCSLLILDLPNAEELVCNLFATLLDAVNEENAGVLEGTVLELLRSMVEEADDLPQQQLDILLGRLLPRAAAEAPAAAALVAALLQRCETTVQPYLQKFLKALLTGVRTDSELKDDAYELFYAVHETVPQALLPLEPQLREELEGEGDGSKRRAAVELVAKLLTQHPGGASKILDEYEPLLKALLGRANDVEAEVRRKATECIAPLMEACGGHEERQLEVLRTVTEKLFDQDEGVRKAAVAAVCAVLQQHPRLAISTATNGRGRLLHCLSLRLRDKKVAVRREVASQMAALVRTWALAAAEGGSGGGGGSTAGGGASPETQTMLAIPVVLCNCGVRDPELRGHIFDTVFRAGIFPAKLAPADVARYWAQLWFQAGDENRQMLAQVLNGKVAIQAQVQHFLALRAAAKEQRASSLMGAAGSMGGGAALGSTRGGGGAGGRRMANPEAQLQSCMAELVGALWGASKPEEGLQKLAEAKDNHIFRGLATLAVHGCTYKDAVAAGKEVLQRVGSKGPAADLVRVLVARLTPNLLSPEVLHAAMEEAEQSEDVQRFLVAVSAAAPRLLAQSLDQVLEMFESDDPAVAECGAKVLAHTGKGMLAHCQRAKRGVPQSLLARLKAMCTEGGPAAVKAAAKALVVLAGQDKAAEVAGELADSLLDRLKAPATLASHGSLLAALKGLSVVGRLLPEVFEPRAGEVLDFVVGDLLEADMSGGKPLPGVEARPAVAAGRLWRRPSAVTASKTAALRTLCQALVPDSSKADITQAMSERAAVVWELLEPLLDSDEGEPQFKPFSLVFPRTSDPEHAELQRETRRAKRRRVEGGSEEDEEQEEDEELDCMDAAWVRYSAVCGLLRLARAYDAAMPAPLYANLALTFQEPLMEPRRAMTAKLQRTVTLLAGRPQTFCAQRAAKYAAVLALFAVDPEEHNRAYAMRTLRDFVLQRRRAVARAAAITAAGGGGGGALLHDMPEFMLAYLLFLLAHHPDYPTQERLDEYSQASQEEREEMYGEGGPFAPFMGMLQFALEALAVPAEQPTSAGEVARGLPPALKLLRTLKFCEDTSVEPRTQEVHQLCDLGLMLLKQISMRLTKGKPAEPGHFPAQVVLPKLIFRPNLQQPKRMDGSHLPPDRYFSPGLYEDDLFMRRLLMPQLPGPAKGRKPRPKPGSQRRKAAKAADGNEEMAEAGEEESVGGTPHHQSDASDGEEERQQPAGSSGRRGKQKVAAGGERGRRGQDDSEGESAGGGAAGDEEAAPAPKAKKRATAAGVKKRGAAAQAAAPTPTRQQPRRGAKGETAGKLKDASDVEEDPDDGWEEDSSQEREAAPRGGRAAPAAAPAPAAKAKEEEEEGDAMALSDFENASLGSPEATPGKSRRKQVTAVAAAVVVKAAAIGLRADTADEEVSQPPQEQQQPRQPRRKQQQQQQQPEGVQSPGQENRAATNGAQGGGSKARGKAAPAAKPAAKSKAGGARPQLKRARA